MTAGKDYIILPAKLHVKKCMWLVFFLNFCLSISCFYF